MLEPVGIAHHLLDGTCTDVAQRLGIATEEALFLQLCVQSFARRLIVVAEDGLSESLDLSDDVPRLVVFDVLLNVADNPSEHLVVSRQLFYHLVDGLLFHLVVVQSDAQVGSELQFAGEVAKDGLEEGVDGHHAKLTIVVHHEGQGLRGLLGSRLSRDVQVVDDLFEIALRVVQSVGDAVELREDALLHLLGGLVGESHGQDGLILLWVEHQQFDIFNSQAEGFSAAGTCFIYG